MAFTNIGSDLTKQRVFEGVLSQSINSESIDWVFRTASTDLILGKVLNSRFDFGISAMDSLQTMAAVAASSTAMAAVIASSTAMAAVAASSTAMAAVAASSTAMTAVAASSTAMAAVIASSTAMAAVAASSTAMTAMIASSTAMTAVVASSTAMAAVAASSTARVSVFSSQTAMAAIFAASGATKQYFFERGSSAKGSTTFNTGNFVVFSSSNAQTSEENVCSCYSYDLTPYSRLNFTGSIVLSSTDYPYSNIGVSTIKGITSSTDITPKVRWTATGCNPISPSFLDISSVDSSKYIQVFAEDGSNASTGTSTITITNMWLS